MKKSKIYIILLLISIISCKNAERKKIKNEILKENIVIEQKTEPKIIIKNTKPFTSSNDSENIQKENIIKEDTNKLKLKFSKLKSTDYFSYKQNYSSGIIIDSTIVNKAGSSFTLSLKGKEKSFSCDVDFNDCTYYKGFIKPLNKYILTYCGKGYCGTYLLDNNTGKIDSLESPFDSECEAPSLSKDQNKLITFSSSVFDGETFISLYKKSLNTKEIEFSKYYAFYTFEWKINEIVWVDKNTIALQIFDGYGGKTGTDLINKRYLKAIIQ